MANGDYQSCWTCRGFIKCAHGTLYNMSCPGVLVWDDNAKQCLYTSTTCSLSTIFSSGNFLFKSLRIALYICCMATLITKVVVIGISLTSIMDTPRTCYIFDLSVLLLHVHLLLCRHILFMHLIPIFIFHLEAGIHYMLQWRTRFEQKIFHFLMFPIFFLWQVYFIVDFPCLCIVFWQTLNTLKLRHFR